MARPKRSLDSASDGPAPKRPSMSDQKRTIAPVDWKMQPGTIVEVVLEEFMCHRYFKIKFENGPNVINGLNGSGKSAVMQGIIIGLGGTPRGSHRGGTLGDLVRRGSGGVAKIELLLWNRDLPNDADPVEGGALRVDHNEEGIPVAVDPVSEKTRAYKPEVLGDFVRIVRTIRDNGSSTLRILNAKGQRVSDRRDYLQSMLMSFGISPENPMCFLTQDWSKEFLIGTDAKKKYLFFKTATGMLAVEKAIEQCQQKKDDCSNDVSLLKERVDFQEMELKNIERQIEFRHRKGELEQQISNLEGELVWAKVAEHQIELDREKAGLEKAIAKEAAIKEERKKLNEELNGKKKVQA
ncbi:unnamed protein product [Cyprideis torosa]|uniref:Rad50/SbcC-type AAA domain-containing protein n=1 Tax=Cyprideis torosa TaxID=163714 RepID=A0A7R8ZVU6_9CRUS|nr:unnamed protein product [Cyprideis torosa]CAG0904100.1 unnamed protein product [Cyprideis torosa]